MKEIKNEVINSEKALAKKLLKSVLALSVAVCIIVVGDTAYEVKSEDDLNDIIAKYDLEDMKVYSRGKEVDIEALKKQQKFYKEFGKKAPSRVNKIQKTNASYDKKITTKVKKYHRKG